MQTPASQSETWRKTNVANLYVHRNGGYYFRVTVGGKQIWESLRTAIEKHRALRAAEKTILAARTGTLTIGQAISLALQEVDQSPDLKPATKHFRRKASMALLKSWPELAKLDPRKITARQVKAARRAPPCQWSKCQASVDERA
jgi:hypothetical protein